MRNFIIGFLLVVLVFNFSSAEPQKKAMVDGPKVVNMQSDKLASVGFRVSGSTEPSDFAIIVDKESVWFQIKDEKGKFHIVPATALLKLK